MSSVTRRGFVTSSIAGAFALAVQPVRADAIKTDDKGLTTQSIHLKTTNGPLPAFVAMPGTKGPFPLVLVVPEIFGVHEYIRDVCRRFAKLGAIAIAPELFARHADVAKMSDMQEIRAVVSKVADAQVLSDLDSAVQWASESGKLALDPSASRPNRAVLSPGPRLGITGFCWGGRIAWLYAARNKDVNAAVAWYGRLTGDVTANQPKHPIDVVPDLKAPVLGLYGGKDQGIPLDAVEKMRAALKTARANGQLAAGESEVVVYPEAGHAFHADYRPSYVKDAAEDGWKRMTAWFKKYGVLG